MRNPKDKVSPTRCQFATAWVLANSCVTSAICGPRAKAQLADYLGALDCRLSPESEALVDALVTPGNRSTPSYRDPMEPIEGGPAAS